MVDSNGKGERGLFHVYCLCNKIIGIMTSYAIRDCLFFILLLKGREEVKKLPLLGKTRLTGLQGQGGVKDLLN